MNIRPAACIVVNNRILTMRYRYGSVDVFNLPGGNLEFGEKMTDCLSRELTEELGVQIAVKEMLCLADVVVEQKQKQTLHAIFRCEITHGTPVLNPAETSALAVEWLPLAELPTIQLYPAIAGSLLQAINHSLPDPFLGRIIQPWAG